MTAFKSAVFTTPGVNSWSNADNVTSCWVLMVGGSAGAYGGPVVAGAETFFGCGGTGAGEICSTFVPVSGSVALTVGAKGIGGKMISDGHGGYIDSPAPTDGGDSTFGPYRACGGRVILNAGDASLYDPASFSRIFGLDGGGPNGGQQQNQTDSSIMTLGKPDSCGWFGGAMGGTGGLDATDPGFDGGGCGGHYAGGTGGPGNASDEGGGGGATQIWGVGSLRGSNGGNSNAPTLHPNGYSATEYGAGAGGGATVGLGATFTTGGDGMSGYVAVFWLA